MKDQYLQDFHKMTLQERMSILSSLHPELNGSYKEGLDLKTADIMIENCVGRISLPVGLGLNFMINQKEYIVPMSTEEPSIVAAASAAAKLIKRFGGFQASSTRPVMIGQIQVLDIDSRVFNSVIEQNCESLIREANLKYCPRMVKRGGGVISVNFINLQETSGVVEISVNVGEAMGANIVNSICEGLANDIAALTPCRIGLRILSNYCPQRMTTSEFRIPISKLSYKSLSGQDLAKYFIESFQFAQLSVNRACTHNKGILNGVVAICVATGQDTRAVEAAAHSWASHSGRYQPLNQYFIENNCLVARMSLPIAIGTKGGALKTNPAYQGSLSLLGNPSSEELAQVIVSVGLACNFSAIRAMVTEGIQKGHMNLHAKNIAIAAGVPGPIVSEVVEYMKSRGEISQQAALDYLSAHHVHVNSRKSYKQQGALNTFHISIKDFSPSVSFTIAFQCPKLSGVHIDIVRDCGASEEKIPGKLFKKKNYEWTYRFLKMLDKVRFESVNPRNNQILQTKVKVFGIWINNISNILIEYLGWETCSSLFSEVFKLNRKGLDQLTEGFEDYTEYGVYLMFEMFHVLCFNLESFESSPIPGSVKLALRIKTEVQEVVFSNIKTFSLDKKNFEQLVFYRKKQMSATLMLLCDYLGENQVDAKMLDDLEKIGDVLELISTVNRDFVKYIKGEINDSNLFLAWVKLGRSEGSYFEYFNRVIGEKMLCLTDEGIRHVKKGEELIREYYTLAPRI